jgi:hypothetical protein
MVPPARWRARGGQRGERERESPGRRPRGVAALRPSQRPCALRPAEPHIPRAAENTVPAPPPRCSCPAPAEGGREGGDGAGPEGAGPSAAATPTPPPRAPAASVSAGSATREEGRGGQGGCSGQWPALGLHTLRTALRRATAATAAARPAPPATRGRWRIADGANRSQSPRTPRRRTARAAGSDGSGFCHVEEERGCDGGGWEPERSPGAFREGLAGRWGPASTSVVSEGLVPALVMQRGLSSWLGVGMSLRRGREILKMLPATLPSVRNFSLYFLASFPGLLPQESSRG